MIKLFTSLVIILLCAGCTVERQKQQYIVTSNGLAKQDYFYCSVGMLMNNMMQNVYDKNNNPITCSDVIELTKQERASYNSGK